MKYTTLGNTDIKISSICLGTMNWGEQNTEKDAFEQMDYAVERGINFFDTAELYPIPPRQESQGLTETFIGKWLKQNNKRDSIVLASKVAGRNDSTYLRNGETPKLDKKNIRTAIEGSLKRLQTDYLDLYQLHWPDRNTNFFGKRAYIHDTNEISVPIEETLEALQELVKEGKVKNIGVSNETAWGLLEFIRQSENNDLPRIQTIQNAYSLIMREFETSLAEIVTKEKIGFLVYSPLSMGVLTGKYLGGVYPEGSRFAYTERNQQRYNPPHAQNVIKKYVDLAKEYNIDPAQMAIAFCISKPFVNSTIIGARTMEQLENNIDSIDLVLPDELLEKIELIHKENPNPIT